MSDVATTPVQAPRSARPRSKDGGLLTRSECFAYGSGIVAFELCNNGFAHLVKPLYNLELGLSPATIGLVLFLCRMWDAVTDPVMGAISDNTRTRWGRRRPWLLVGATLCAVAYPLLWLPTRAWSPEAISNYLLGAAVLYYMFFTIFAVPYMALGFEITPDSQERVRLQVWRSAFAFVPPVAAGWFYWLCQHPIFANPMSGARWLGLGVAGIILVAGSLTATRTRERYYPIAAQQRRMSFRSSLHATCRNRPFAVVMLVCVLLMVANGALRSLGSYAKIFIVASGDTRLGAELNGWSGVVSAVAGLAMLPFVGPLVRRFGKRRVLGASLLAGVGGSVATWFLLQPGFYVLCLLPMLLGGPTAAVFWIVVNAMKADCCDVDELQTGMRREGAYGAVSNFLQKLAISFSLLLSGQILVWVGFEALRGAAQSPDALLGIRVACTLANAGILLVSYAVLQRYPLDERRMMSVRTELEKRRGKL